MAEQTLTPLSMDPESRPAYSSGAYLYLLDRDVAGLRRRVEYLRTLPGLGHVEIWVEELGLEPAALGELKEMLAGWRVTVHAPYLQLSMISHHDVVRGAAADVYRRTLQLADELSAEVVSFHGGTRPFLVDEALAQDQLAAMFTALRTQGGKAEPTLKNMPIEGTRLEVYPASLEQLRRSLERMPDLRVTLDVGYCVRNRENWIAFLRTHAARIINVHLHDAVAEGEMHLRLGSGEMDAFALARLLRAVGYSGFVSLATVGHKDTTASWQLWRQAQAEASQETTATVSAAELQKPN